jgi:hypothetical protein
MGVVIEICVKYPGVGLERGGLTYVPVNVVKGTQFGHFGGFRTSAPVSRGELGPRGI